MIDVTSHELRQPVSAILNCSSLVRSNLAKLRDELERRSQADKSFGLNKELLPKIEEDLEALDAIYQVCVKANYICLILICLRKCGLAQGKYGTPHDLVPTC